MNEKHSSQHRSARNLKEIALKSVALKDFAAAEEENHERGISNPVL